ncbi:MAG: polysaccharide biosynthesis protein, partial [Pseudomonadota bacterium]
AQSLGGVLALAAALGFSGSMMRLVASYRSAGENRRLLALVRGSRRLILGASAAVAVLLFAASIVFPNQRPGLLWTALLVIPLTLDVWRESTMRGFHRISAAILPRQVLLPLCTLAVVLVAGISNTTTAMGVFLGALVLLEGWSLLQLQRMLPRPGDETALPFETKHWLGISLPMGLSSLASFGITRWDVAALGLIVGLEAAGPYAAAARTALLGSVVLRIINLVTAPWLAESYHSGEIGRFRKQLVYSTAASALLGLPLFMAVFLFPERVMGLFGPGYEQAAPLLRILVVAQFVNLITGPAGLALTMSRYERLNLVITFAAAAASLLGLLVFTQPYGAEGVALITASAVILQNLLLFIASIALFSRATPLATTNAC